MRSEVEQAADTRMGTPRRRLLAGGALTLLLAGSLAFATPAFAQEEDNGETTATGEVTEDTTVSTDDSAGTTVEVGASGEAAAEGDAAAVGATDTTAETAAAPAAAGAAAPTTLPSTGVGAMDNASLSLIGLVAAGAVTAGAVAVRGHRRAEARV
jgi:hypothetical protein